MISYRSIVKVLCLSLFALATLGSGVTMADESEITKIYTGEGEIIEVYLYVTPPTNELIRYPNSCNTGLEQISLQGDIGIPPSTILYLCYDPSQGIPSCYSSTGWVYPNGTLLKDLDCPYRQDTSPHPYINTGEAVGLHGVKLWKWKREQARNTIVCLLYNCESSLSTLKLLKKYQRVRKLRITGTLNKQTWENLLSEMDIPALRQ